jgi:trehalose/maltose hydrolase-like predicted phosphorylase
MVNDGSVTAPSALDATFEAVVFDWDGTAVPDRAADAAAVRRRVEALCAAGVHLFVVSGTHVGNIDEQLRARPSGPGQLFLCCNRGSEVFEVVGDEPALVYRRTATPQEDQGLNRAAELTLEALRTRGLEAKVVSSRLNRRKIDLIDLPEWASPKKADIARLADAVATRLAAVGIDGLSEVVTLATRSARAAGLGDPRITSDVKHVEIGLTDKSESAQFAASWLARQGITGRLILIGGDEFGSIGGVAGSDSLMLVPSVTRSPVVSVGVEPGGVPRAVFHVMGGPASFLAILDDQLARRADGRVPQVDDDAQWVLPIPSGRAHERVAEAMGALGNGWAGVRASREENGPGSSPLFYVAGVFTPDARLLPGPIWTDLDVTGTTRHSTKRFLDLRTATLARFGGGGDDGGSRSLRSVRLLSATLPNAMALRAEGPEALVSTGDVLRPPGDAEFESTTAQGICTARTKRGVHEIAVAARDNVAVRSGLRIVERLAAWGTCQAKGGSATEAARRHLGEVESRGFDGLLAEHRAAWADMWRDAEVVIEGTQEARQDQLAARFSVFHLLASVADAGEAAVGARGLSGPAYSGHVFWDADVFVLPAVAALRPQAARAMLEYRIRRLPAARAAATDLGLAGARFPWESAEDGRDVTPRSVRGLGGRSIPVETGFHEEHIVADVAWAAAHYANRCEDEAFLYGAGRDLLVDTARYWASRITVGSDGHGHIDGVMGPDEYHQVVNDNAYTNVMARWNLRRGAEILSDSDRNADGREAARWRELARRMADGWDHDRGTYEQFAGYFDLEPLLVASVAPPQVTIDIVLGPDRVAGSQLIKQADVAMLYHLVPDEVQAESLHACLEYYEPRTAHGSSLSPAISSSLLARAGMPDRALELFRIASRLDLDDLTKTTAGGVHLAAMGGVWQALAFGFLGLRAGPEALAMDPQLPEAWSTLSLRFRFRGKRVGVRATHEDVAVSCEEPLTVRIAGGSPVNCNPPVTVHRLLTPAATTTSASSRSGHQLERNQP